ncbi:MAG TPA: hypothetical protein P5279_13265 [Anaerohalosphaeraceae bacterium]|nr:hypothetical protein [Anaerohalosphaeraceae bacterium]HRT51459.1 hypothetical protein [Anaerohalosphaeraceae bacterium]HRT87506.1 hypothetical protein [Anaerohalosphaeraceae bacterium]
MAKKKPKVDLLAPPPSFEEWKRSIDPKTEFNRLMNGLIDSLFTYEQNIPIPLTQGFLLGKHDSETLGEFLLKETSNQIQKAISCLIYLIGKIGIPDDIKDRCRFALYGINKQFTAIDIYCTCNGQESDNAQAAKDHLKQMAAICNQRFTPILNDCLCAKAVKKPEDLITLTVAVRNYNVSKCTLHRAIKDGRLTSYKHGKRNSPVKISKSEIEKYWPKK